MQKKDLAVIKIEVRPVAVKADLGNSSTEIVIGVIVFVTNTIKIVKELIIFIKYKASKLEVFKVAITITKRVGKSIKIIRQ